MKYDTQHLTYCTSTSIDQKHIPYCVGLVQQEYEKLRDKAPATIPMLVTQQDTYQSNGASSSSYDDTWQQTGTNDCDGRCSRDFKANGIESVGDFMSACLSNTQGRAPKVTLSPADGGAEVLITDPSTYQHNPVDTLMCNKPIPGLKCKTWTPMEERCKL